ncbi:FAD-dependent pyridine nucleotide-disulfide oxidoreductase [Tepidicaulis marinus]|uniref:FAD-dependent pyridine nucleotide-disulfide oxidoreductase n=1 Tax=Tepidicaulis marinus TaxID=1333998 RepID=A0A081BE42_9HYPH|nr:FAD-dependent oxidoreductase [Tepidicaulis marinus]GAK46310.1 FAD-dependent pyridine nucleotide-disulfide oxidoreductase [Tepidicaulis marinus]
MSDHVVIVGAGHAAGQAAASLRQEGYEGAITMIGNEPYIPYQRPPLSKKFLAGEIGIDRVYFKPPEFYEKENVTVKLGTRVTEIDRNAKTVHTDKGETLTYSKLLLTTGSRARELNLPGFDLEGVFYLRNVGDVEGIQSYFNKGGKCVIVGGGYIGLEVAAVAAKHGIDVTVLEMAPMVMARVVDPIVSRFYERVHREEGVKIVTGAAVSGFEGKNGQLTKVTCADGTAHEADFVVVGVGILPNVELAVEANLKVENGIAVDECCRTSDPDIYAAGDCTNHPNPLLGERLRLESVHNALEQAKTAAAAICGKEKPYAQIPWFWSDQYDLKLQIVGLSAGYDQAVVRGNPDEGRSFAVFYLKEGRLIAVDAINRAPEFMMSKQLIAKGVSIPAEKLRDESINMKEMAAYAT